MQKYTTKRFTGSRVHCESFCHLIDAMYGFNDTCTLQTITPGLSYAQTSQSQACDLSLKNLVKKNSAYIQVHTVTFNQYS